MLKALSSLGLNFGNSGDTDNNFQTQLLKSLGSQLFGGGSGANGSLDPTQLLNLFSKSSQDAASSSAGGIVGNLVTTGLENNHFNKLSKSTGLDVADLKADGKNSFLFGAKSEKALGNWNAIGNTAGMASSLGKGLGLLKDKSRQTKTQSTIDRVYDGVASALPGPIGAIMKTAGLGTDILRTFGVHTDNMTTQDKILGSKLFAMTGVGLVNTIGGKKAHDYKESAEDKMNVAKVEPSYTGFDDVRKGAQFKSGKKYGLFSRRARKKANREIAEANRQRGIVSNIGENAEIDFLASENPYLSMSNSFMQQGGWDYKGMRAAKHGMKFKESINKARSILPKLQDAQLQSFKKGGSMNVIPTGKLHAHLNHMGKNDLDVTRKGVPVVSIGKGGELTQHAEIEKEEIIMRLEITKKLEKLAALGTDEAAIEAGKILVYEILENTDDKAELMDKINI